MTRARDLVEQVSALLSAGDLDAAGRLVDSVASVDPAAYECGYAAIALFKRDADVALEHAALAIEHGAPALGHELCATARMIAGDPDGAIDAARRAVGVEDTAHTRANLGSILVAAGRSEDAIAVLKQLATEHPGDADTMLALAAAYVQLSEYGDAITWYARAFDARPADPRPIQNLMQMFAEIGKWLGAVAALELGRKGEPPPNVEATLDLVMLRLVQQIAQPFPGRNVVSDADRAVTSALASAARRPPAVQLVVARTLADLGRLESVREIVGRLEAQPLADPDRASLCYLQGYLAQHGGDPARALELYEKALALDPERVDACINATSLLLADASPDALERIPALVAKVPASKRPPELLFNHAAYLARSGKRGDARTALEAVLRRTGGAGPIGEGARKALAQLHGR